VSSCHRVENDRASSRGPEPNPGAHALAGPVGECHVVGVGIGTLDDQLGGSAAGDREHQLVLDGGEEDLGRLRGTVVIGATGFEQLAQLLVEALLRAADVADAVDAEAPFDSPQYRGALVVGEIVARPLAQANDAAARTKLRQLSMQLTGLE